MEKNFKLLDKTLEKIKNNPEEWNQEMWECNITDNNGNTCGTAYCFAGHAMILGFEKKINKDNFLEEIKKIVPSAFLVTTFERDSFSSMSYIPDGDESVESSTNIIPKVAQKMLGLTREEAKKLFDPYNYLEDIEKLINSWKS